MDALIMLTGLVVIGLLVFAMYTNGVPPTPSLPHVRRVAVSLLPDNARHLAELGAGWGGVSLAFKRARPDMRVDAFETSLLPYIVCRVRGGSRINVQKADFMQADLARYDVLYCYLTPAHMAALAPKVAAGTVVISAAFAVPNWVPDKVVKTGITPVYRYIAP